jgi:hypothetical protein
LLLASASCSASTASVTFDGTGGGPPGSDASVAYDAAPYATGIDASAFAVAPVVQGNPLCNAMAQSSCYPDTMQGQCTAPIEGGAIVGRIGNDADAAGDASLDASTGSSPHADDASAVASDAAASDAEGYADATASADAEAIVDAAADVDAGTDAAAPNPFGCHVTQLSDAGIAPVCTTAGAGADGDSCTDSRDCAAGYECVGAGTCRRYCCSGSCDSTHFCDVQPEAHPAGAGAPVPVPVCMPLQPCGLPGEASDAGRCPSAVETCAVVLAGSSSELVPVASCVQTGMAPVGASCEAQHCAAGLTCIGSWGNKICYTLCDTTDASAECHGSQVCSGGLPLFPDPSTGVCKEPVQADY